MYKRKNLIKVFFVIKSTKNQCYWKKLNIVLFVFLWDTYWSFCPSVRNTFVSASLLYNQSIIYAIVDGWNFAGLLTTIRRCVAYHILVCPPKVKVSNFSFHGTPIWSIYLSQMIRYSRACGSSQDFLDRGLLLTKKLMNQGFLLVKLNSSLRKCYGRHHDFVDRFGISVSNMTTDMFHLS